MGDEMPHLWEKFSNQVRKGRVGLQNQIEAPVKRQSKNTGKILLQLEMLAERKGRMIEEKLTRIQENSRKLAAELKSLADALDFIRFDNVNIDPTADEYAGCFNCVHAADSESMCILRCCKHAIHTLKECYKKG